MDKCFCHFNGFKVKDADARKMIQNLETVKEINTGRYITFWVGTQVEYNAIQKKDDACLYIITDDTSEEDLEREIAELKAASTPIDITEQVDFHYEEKEVLPGISTGVICNEVEKHKILYYPNMGLVFYSVTFSGEGTWSEKESLSYRMRGEYVPIKDVPFTELSRNGMFRSVLTGVYTGQNVGTSTFAVYNNVGETSGFWSATFSGWYICDRGDTNDF